MTTPPRPTIVVRPALVELTDEALAALQASDHGIYLRGRLLVQVARCASDLRWLTRPRGAPVIVPLTAGRLLDRLDRAAIWITPGKHARPTTPPRWVADQILERLEWPFPLLAGVVEAPTLQPHGTLLSTAGYDAESALLYWPDGEYFLGPAEPTREDVDTAVAALLDPVQDFPFVGDKGEAGKAAYIAATLSLAARHAISGPVPAFAIVSPTPGTGKGLLAAVISLIGSGRTPAVMTDVAERDEMRKRLLSLAIAGTPVVLLDNLSGVLGSDALAAALTATEVEDRLLGRSQMVRAPLTSVWLITGNNLGFKRTLGRRVLPVELDAQVEHPEDRGGFVYDNLLDRVQAQRRGLVVAALTVLRGYWVAGRPRHGKPRMGSFEAWDDLVRGACVWAGLTDPAATDDPSHGRGRLRAEGDEDLAALGILLAALTMAFGDQPFTCAQVLTRATTTDEPLRIALEEAGAADRTGKLTARALGYRFRAVQDRLINGHKLITERADRHAKIRLWRIDAGAAGDAGYAGDNPSRGDYEQGAPNIPVAKTLFGQRLETSPPSPASPANEDDALPF